MSEITLRILGPRGHGEETVLGDDLAGAVLPKFVEEYGMPLSDVWIARVQKNGAVLDPMSSFDEQGIEDGMTIQIEALGTGPVYAGYAAEQSAEAADILIDRTEKNFYPEPPTRGLQRLRLVAKAFLHGSTNTTIDGDTRAAIASMLYGDTKKRNRLRHAIDSTSYEMLLDACIRQGHVKKAGVVAVIGSGPKIGRSTIATIIALTLSEKRRERVVLLEGDPRSSFLQLATNAHIISVAEAAHNLTPENQRRGKTVLSMLSHTPNGLYVLPAQNDDGNIATPEDYAVVINAFKDHVGFMIIDCGPNIFSRETVAELKLSDQVVLVSGTDPLAGLTTAQMVQDLRSIDRPLTIVINHVQDPDDLQAGFDIKRFVGLTSAENNIAVCIMPESAEGASLVSQETFAWRDMPISWPYAVRELGAVLIGRWASQDMGVIAER
jgi:MinD-like ATPase involved in chromosome partitioning or flagellar assembly